MKHFVSPLLLLFAAGCCCQPVPQTYLLEAENMGDLGAFEINESDGSGGASIHAIGEGCRARGTYDIPTAGKYTILLRDQSYGDNLRTMELLVDGKVIGSGGDAARRNGEESRPAWVWSKIGQVQLTAGKHEITLRTTGPNARPDALLLVPGEAPLPADNTLPEKYQKLDATNAVNVIGEFKLNCHTLKAPFGAYHCGEPIIFEIAPTLDGKLMKSGKILYTLTGDDGKRSEGTFELAGNPVRITTTLDRPGFVRLQLSLQDADGKTFRGAPRFDSCAGADEEKIEQIAEPEDFDAFWAREKALLKTMPITPTLTEIAGQDQKNFRTFEVGVPCPGNAPVTGFLVMPLGAKEKSLPAEVEFQGYGFRMPTAPFPKKGRICFVINAHGMPLHQTKESLHSFAAQHDHYALHDTANPQTAYFHGMVLRVLRALEFVRTFPEWNGVDLMVTGGSQGGLQSLWAAGLDDKVTFCRPFIPWCCNLGSEHFGYMPKDWGVDYTDGARYFDAANFAKRIKCPVEITRAGLGDFVCPPSGIARMYYNLKCPKKIIWFVNCAHPDPPGKCETFTTQTNDFQVPAAFDAPLR